MLEGMGVFASLLRGLRLGKLAQKLVEVNLVLGIVRLALIVLAVVFSAIPLPFEADMTGNALYAWWAFVTLLYLIASDFFQVARLAAFLQFLRLSPTPRWKCPGSPEPGCPISRPPLARCGKDRNCGCNFQQPGSPTVFTPNILCLPHLANRQGDVWQPCQGDGSSSTPISAA